MDLGLKDKVIIVTGGAKGIGGDDQGTGDVANGGRADDQASRHQRRHGHDAR